MRKNSFQVCWTEQWVKSLRDLPPTMTFEQKSWAGQFSGGPRRHVDTAGGEEGQLNRAARWEGVFPLKLPSGPLRAPVRSMNAKCERTSVDPAESSPDRFCRVPPYQRRPEPLSGPMRDRKSRAHARFPAILRDVRKLRDWMVDGGVYCELLSPYQFPVKQGNNRESQSLRLFSRLYDTHKAAEMLGFSLNSLGNEQGIIFPDQGISKRYQGFFRPVQGNSSSSRVRNMHGLLGSALGSGQAT